MKEFGPVVPVVTPCHPDGTIDPDGARSVVTEMIEAGAEGLFVAGSTGRGPWLSQGNRQEICRIAREVTPDEKPILAGCMASGLPEMLENASAMADSGAQIAIVTVPGYFNYNPREIETIFLQFADRSPIPVIVYDIPEFTGQKLRSETILRLAEHKNIIGFKDSSADYPRFKEALDLLRYRSDFYLMQGKEHLLVDSLTAGASGFIVSMIHLAPEPFTALYTAVQQNRLDAARALQEGITRGLTILRSAIDRRPESSTLFHMLNLTLQERGICQNILLEHEGDMPAWLRESTHQSVQACMSGLTAVHS